MKDYPTKKQRLVTLEARHDALLDAIDALTAKMKLLEGRIAKLENAPYTVVCVPDAGVSTYTWTATNDAS